MVFLELTQLHMNQNKYLLNQTKMNGSNIYHVYNGNRGKGYKLVFIWLTFLLRIGT